jgi:hypothetical protein
MRQAQSVTEFMDQNRHDIDPVRWGVGVIHPRLGYVVALFRIVDIAGQSTPR